MKIGIVGSGKVGAALGKWMARTGANVVFTSKKEASAKAAASEAGHGARSLGLEDLVRESELILLTTPFDSVREILEKTQPLLEGKILVDVTNPITADHRALKIGHDDSGAETIARAAPKARVVKAFNAVFAEVYQAQTPVLHDRQIAIFFAGDDAAAKRKISQLIAQLGFEPIDAGPLKNARYLEPLSLLNIHLGKEQGLGTKIGFALAR